MRSMATAPFAERLGNPAERAVQPARIRRIGNSREWRRTGLPPLTNVTKPKAAYSTAGRITFLHDGGSLQEKPTRRRYRSAFELPARARAEAHDIPRFTPHRGGEDDLNAIPTHVDRYRCRGTASWLFHHGARTAIRQGRASAAARLLVSGDYRGGQDRVACRSDCDR